MLAFHLLEYHSLEGLNPELLQFPALSFMLQSVTQFIKFLLMFWAKYDTCHWRSAPKSSQYFTILIHSMEKISVSTSPVWPDFECL